MQVYHRVEMDANTRGSMAFENWTYCSQMFNQNCKFMINRPISGSKGQWEKPLLFVNVTETHLKNNVFNPIL